MNTTIDRVIVIAFGSIAALLMSAHANAQTDLDAHRKLGGEELSVLDLEQIHSNTTFTGTFRPLFGKEADVPFEMYNGSDGERVFLFQGRTQIIKWWIEEERFCHTGLSTRAIPCDWIFYRLDEEYRMFHPDGSLHAVFAVEEGDPRQLQP